MKPSQIAIQFYTLRDHCKTVEDFTATCRKVRDIGYEAVQISGVDRNVVPEQQIAQICADMGLTICATHENADEILNDPLTVVERLKTLGTHLTAYPFPAGVDFGSEDAVAELITKLNAAGQQLAAHGQVLTYHNHHHEFRKLNGRLILERIFDETDPKAVQGEPDTYWVQYGGGDPVAWCHKLKGRLPMIHLKDYRINAEAEIEFSEVGQGNLDIPAIIRAAEAAGCQWFIVEQDSCPGDPFASIRLSFDYLRSLAES